MGKIITKVVVKVMPFCSIHSGCSNNICTDCNKPISMIADDVQLTSSSDIYTYVYIQGVTEKIIFKDFLKTV